MRSPGLVRFGLLAAFIGCAGCSVEAMKITLEATDTASTVFKDAHDEARIKRDAAASRRLGELSGSRRLTAAEVHPLQRIVADAKADGRVTMEEADRILVEMERVAAAHSR